MPDRETTGQPTPQTEPHHIDCGCGFNLSAHLPPEPIMNALSPHGEPPPPSDDDYFCAELDLGDAREYTGPGEPSPVALCSCCNDRIATVHEASQSFCATCYEAGAARDDRDQT